MSKKIASAAVAAITLVNGLGAVPSENTTASVTAPVSVSSDAAVETTYAANAKFESGSAATIEATNDTDSATAIGSAISGYYVKPGDQTVYGQFVIDWKDFQFVTETYDNGLTTLSGHLLDEGDWEFSFDEANHCCKGDDFAPLTWHDDGFAIGMPIAAHKGETTVDGWTFKAEGRVSYCPGPGTTFVYGDGWEALVLDYRHYAEWKYAEWQNTFADYEKYALVAYGNDSWVIATDGAPAIVAEGEEVEETTVSSEVSETKEIYTVIDKISKNITPMTGVSDPKYGAIEWSEYIREDSQGADGSVYWLDGELNGHQFSIEIDSVDAPLGFTENHTWSAAIVPADYVNYHDVSILHYGKYTINVQRNNVNVVEGETGETHSFNLEGNACQDTAVVLATISDGKHAKCVTFRPELISVIYALGLN
ncbi:MAG: hypothetical protein Q4A96_02060 [Candidatus Saccharibacteria bacterium]|nr:hypothetical protein [Candidatus Saccharibacteria bacterium]